VGIKIDTDNLYYKYSEATEQLIIARIQRSDDFFHLALAKDALERFDPTPIHLVLPYVPYARQDRVCCKGESFSLKVFAQLINSLNFAKVTVIDPHSAVVDGVFNRVRSISQFEVIQSYDAFAARVMRGATFVSPDAGANKKTSELAGYFNHASFIRADKLRNLATGEILETVVYADDLGGQDVVIADDIGDGCRTFTELAKVLKAKGAGKVILYVTHGIFSKGTKVLYQNGIDEIWTTDTYYDTFPAGIGDEVNVLKIEDTLPI
jgi:ribose-phosphate pyrophosphokinase